MPFDYKDYISNSNGLKIENQNKQLENHLKEVFPDEITEYIQHNQVVQQLNLTINSLSEDGSQEDRSEKKKIAEQVRAKVYMKAFAELKASGDDKEKFAYYYQLLQEMEKFKFHEVGASLTETQEIMNLRENAKTFRAFESSVSSESDDGIKMATFIRSQKRIVKQAKVDIAKENTEQAILAGKKTSPEFLDQGTEYWYTDEDINSILGAQLGKDKESLADAVFQMEAQAVGATDGKVTAETNQALFKDALKRRMAEMNYPRKLVIPVNVGGNHWVGVSLEFGEDRKATSAVLMDSLASGERHKNTIKDILEEANILEIHGQVKLRNKPVKQQTNGSDCGPWTIHNLVENAKENEPQYDHTAGRHIRADHQELVKDNGLSPAQQADISGEGVGKQQGSPAQGQTGQPQSGTALTVKYGSEEYNNLRIALAKKMLSGLPENCRDFTNDPRVLKMVDEALKKANNGKEFQEEEEINLHKLSRLENHLSDQANDLMAQIGHESKKSYSFYADDMRGQHGENKELAEQLTEPQFDNCFNKALNSFEKLDKIKKEKEESRWSRFKYGTMDAISGLKPKNWSPSTKIYAAAVAAILIPPPVGLLVASYAALKGCLESKTGKKIVNGGKAILKGVGKVLSAVPAAVVGLGAGVAFVGSLPVALVKSAKNKEWQWAIRPQAVVNGTVNVYNLTQKDLPNKIMGEPVGKIDTAIDKNSLIEVMREAVKPRPAAEEQPTQVEEKGKGKGQSSQSQPPSPQSQKVEQLSPPVEQDLSQSQHKVEDRLDLAAATTGSGGEREQAKPDEVEQDLSQARENSLIEELDLAGVDLKGLEGVTEAASAKQVTSDRSHEGSVKGQLRKQRNIR